MGGMQLAVFASKSTAKQLSNAIRVCEVPCGVGNVLANKGAVAACVQLEDVKMVYVCAHLAAHTRNVRQRNSDYWRIAKEVTRKMPQEWTRSVPARREGPKRKSRRKRRKTTQPPIEDLSSKSLYKEWSSRFEELLQAHRAELAGQSASNHQDEVIDVFEPADVCIFFGDLNYRVDMPRLEMELSLLDAKLTPPSQSTVEWRANETHVKVETQVYGLLLHDQLRREVCAGRVCLNFEEGPIVFPPTFKFDKNSEKFDTSAKQRWTCRCASILDSSYSAQRNRCPAWTDRILFKSKRIGESSTAVLSLESYGSVLSAQHSDHRPVYARFTLRPRIAT